jgi:hypothetical protein
VKGWRGVREIGVRKMKCEGGHWDVDYDSRGGRTGLLGRGGYFGRLRGQRQRLRVANRREAGVFLVAVVAEVLLIKELELGKGGEVKIRLVWEVHIGSEKDEVVCLELVELVVSGAQNQRSFVDEIGEIEEQV